MPNHPNRNWRQQAEIAVERWIKSPEGEELITLPLRPEFGFAEARRMVRGAYLAGVASTHKPKEPKP